MTEFSSVVTRKGQVTIPAEIRQALGLREGDHVAIAVEKDQVRLTKRGSVVARTAALLKGDEPPLSAEALRQAAEESIAQAVVERSGG